MPKVIKTSIRFCVKKWIPLSVNRRLLEWEHARQGRGPGGLFMRRIGVLWRTRPIRPEFGWRFGQCIDRYYIEKFIDRYSDDIQGRVLEFAEDRYTHRFGGSRVTYSDILHSKPGNPKATIVADLTDAGELESDTFDCIIMTQTLQFIYDTRAAIQTLYRILKPGGVLLATFPGLSQISRYDMDSWGEYWRFTTLSARKLFAEAFPEESLIVEAHGNVLASIAFLDGLLSRELSEEELDYRDHDYELSITLRAVKPRVSS
jgi:SAM-dependent methyltransferase